MMSLWNPSNICLSRWAITHLSVSLTALSLMGTAICTRILWTSKLGLRLPPSPERSNSYVETRDWNIDQCHKSRQFMCPIGGAFGYWINHQRAPVIWNPQDPSKYVTSLDFDNQANVIIGASNDDRMHVYDVKGGKFNKSVARNMVFILPGSPCEYQDW